MSCKNVETSETSQVLMLSREDVRSERDLLSREKSDLFGMYVWMDLFVINV